MSYHELERLLSDRVSEAACLQWSDLPDAVRAHAGLVLADTVGVIAAGARSPEIVALAADPVLGLGVRGSARALVARCPAGDPATVAWLNGTAGTFLELDEGFRPTGHPAVHVVPAALATAEAVHADGPRLGTALVAGYEVAARLFESFALPRPMHPHGHFGALGAATAVAMLRGDDPLAVVAVAATQTLLTGWAACYEGATARNTWSGHAGRAAVQASVLHRAGFRGSLASLLSVVAPYAVDPDGLTDPLDVGALRIRRNYFKLHSACALTHTAIDATLQAWSQLDAGPDDIEEIVVATVANNLRVERPAAPNSLSTRFSLPYAVATAIRSGDTGPDAFAWRPEVAELAAKVHIEVDPVLDDLWPSAAPARVRILTRAASAEVRVDNPHGHHADPVDRHELSEKFVRLGGRRTAFDELAGIGDIDDCARLALENVVG